MGVELGIGLWFALAVLTALLTLVPFIGPLIATVPVVALVAMQKRWVEHTLGEKVA